MNILEILNRKRLNFTSVDELDYKPKDIIYRDKTMLIACDGTKLMILSTWWGLIKNSYFTFEGQKGESAVLKKGEALLADMVEYIPAKPIPYAYLNRGNLANPIEFQPGESLIQYVERYYKLIYHEDIRSARVPVFKGKRIIRMKLILPAGEVMVGEGSNEETAKNDAAGKVLTQLCIPH